VKLVIEPGDFPETSGKTPDVIADEVYGWWVKIEKRAGRPAGAAFYHRGAGIRIEPEQLTVEIVGAPSVESEPVAEKPKATRGPDGKFVKSEPTLTGPALPDVTSWYEEG
jgi:hypothetical protein